MFLILAAVAITWPLSPLDRAWAKLAYDSAVHDVAAFAADRTKIVDLDRAVLAEWGAKPRETYRAAGYSVATYTGPTRVRGDRWQSAYFAVVSPDGDLQPPTFWEVTPAFSPNGGAVWFLSVSSCKLSSGDPVVGHPRRWRTSGLKDPPAYGDFKSGLAELAGTPGAFPADTTTAHSPGTTCLYVGNLSTRNLLPVATTP